MPYKDPAKANAGRRRRYYANLPYEQDRARSRGRQRHGGPEEHSRLWEAQDGCCYLCGRPFLPGQRVQVDHDHSCCAPERPGWSDSCPYCRRGLAHFQCNVIIGMAGEDMDLLRAIIERFPPAQAATRQRIASKPDQQEPLFA